MGRLIKVNGVLRQKAGGRGQKGLRKGVPKKVIYFSYFKLFYFKLLAMSYREQFIWKRGIQLSVNCYKLTEHFPKSELYGLTKAYAL